MDVADLAALYASSSSDVTYPADVFFVGPDLRDTLRDIGIRLRGNTSLGAAKKSIKLDLNEYGDLDLERLEKLNVNAEKNDPTLLRSRLSFELYRAAGVPAPRTSHVRLYLNGVYYGLYLHTEHVDEEFVKRRFAGPVGNLYKCLYPATLAYRGPSGDDYKVTEFGRRTYELRTNRDADDYADLARLVTVLTQTPVAELPCALEPIFDVDAFLRAQAVDALVGNWDGYAYNVNNYYLYRDPADGRFVYVPYDLDNSWGIDWLGRDWAERDIMSWSRSGHERPLYTRIMAIRRYRDRYAYYLRQLLQTEFTEAALHARIDALRGLTEDAAEADPRRPLDFGWDVADYRASFTEPLAPHVDYGLKSYVTRRRERALAQVPTVDIVPHLDDARLDTVLTGRATALRVRVTEDGGAPRVRLHYRLNGSAYASVELEPSGTGSFAGALPAQDADGWLDYYVTATDDAGQVGRLPACGHYSARVRQATSEVRINELMADNATALADEAGEFDDWIELFNAGASSASLAGMSLTDDPDDTARWRLPAITVPADGYVLLWADGDEEQGERHGPFGLRRGGESLSLHAADGALVDAVRFGEQAPDRAYARIPNGSGAFRAVAGGTPGARNAAASATRHSALGIHLELHPNPTADIAQLVVRATEAAAMPEAWRLLDARGVELRRGDFETGFRARRANLQLAALPSGTYWCVIRLADGTQVVRPLARR